MATHRAQWLLALCLMEPAWAQDVAPGAGDDPVARSSATPLAGLTWSQAANLDGVSLSVTARGAATAERPALEEAIIACHAKLLQLVAMAPDERTSGLFERKLIIEDERILDDGSAEITVRIGLADFVAVVNELRGVVPLQLPPTTADAPPLLPSKVVPVLIRPDGSMETVGEPQPTARPGPAEPQFGAISTVPDAMAVYNSVGLDHAAQGNLADAVTAFERAIEADPESTLAAEPHCNLAAVYFHQKKLTEALEHYQRAAELDPTYPLARYGLGVTYRLLGRPALAINELRIFLQLEPVGSLAQAAATLLEQMGVLPPPPEESGEGAVPPVVRQ